MPAGLQFYKCSFLVDAILDHHSGCSYVVFQPENRRQFLSHGPCVMDVCFRRTANLYLDVDKMPPLILRPSQENSTSFSHSSKRRDDDEQLQVQETKVCATPATSLSFRRLPPPVGSRVMRCDKRIEARKSAKAGTD